MRSGPLRLLAPLAALLAALLLFALFFTNGVMLYGIHASRGWMRGALELQSAASTISAGLIEADAGARGFLLTADGSYLEPFRRAKETLPKLTLEMQRLAREDPVQAQRVVVLERLIEAKLDELGRTIERYGRGETHAA